MLAPSLAAPRCGLRTSLRFWAGVAVETLGRRRFALALSRRIAGRPVVATGEDALPRKGTFVLAVNHYEAGLTLDVLAAVLAAADRAHAGTGNACMVVVGQRSRAGDPSRLRRLLRWLVARFFDRWTANVIRIPIGSDTPALAALRAWRRRLARQPALVFPEGVARRELGAMRAGAGRWLGGLGVPTVPAGVWWADEGWRVAFGDPVDWSPSSDLRDLQLGLAIAELLPEAVAPRWQALLARWREAHDEQASPARC